MPSCVKQDKYIFLICNILYVWVWYINLIFDFIALLRRIWNLLAKKMKTKPDQFNPPHATRTHSSFLIPFFHFPWLFIAYSPIWKCPSWKVIKLLYSYFLLLSTKACQCPETLQFSGLILWLIASTLYTPRFLIGFIVLLLFIPSFFSYRNKSATQRLAAFLSIVRGSKSSNRTLAAEVKVDSSLAVRRGY